MDDLPEDMDYFPIHLKPLLGAPGVWAISARVQRILHRHHGWAWAEGQVNQGATFYFTLPEPP